MKTIPQEVSLFLCLEKDDEKNVSKMQMRVWKMHNGTTVVVRLFKHVPDSDKVLWNEERDNNEVDNLILDNLKELKVIQNSENWNYSVQDANDFCKKDEYEEKEKCYYFSWSVKPGLLRF